VTPDDLDLRVSDADRERAVSLLREHTVAGRLTLEELSERVELAYAARTEGELAAVASDLPAPATAVAAPAPRGRRWTVALIGDVKRMGRWRLVDRTVALLGIGDLELDLRGAVIDDPEPTITVAALIGDVTVVVPEGVAVEVSGFVVIGDRRDDAADAPLHPGAPVVHLRVVGLIADVRVQVAPS
jgi:hypothetical protein